MYCGCVVIRKLIRNFLLKSLEEHPTDFVTRVLLVFFPTYSDSDITLTESPNRYVFNATSLKTPSNWVKEKQVFDFSGASAVGEEAVNVKEEVWTVNYILSIFPFIIMLLVIIASTPAHTFLLFSDISHSNCI